MGEAGGIEETLAQRAGIAFSPIVTGQIRGRAPWQAARNLWRMRRGAQQTAAIIQEFDPDVAFITGGYVTAPVAWAVWNRSRRGKKLPLLIYLPDLTPGMAIKVTARLADRVAVSFPEVARYFPGKAVVTGYPVRRELFEIDKQAARASLGLGQGGVELPVLLAFGGSRGARSINRSVIAALPALLPQCEVLHISGDLDWPEVETAAAGLSSDLRARYHPYRYLNEEMLRALRAADLVIARAGASTLGEFPAARLPSILVPYPYAGQHQDANAAYLAGHGAALVVRDAELPLRLEKVVLELLADRSRLEGMAAAAGALARPDATANLAGLLRKLAGK